MHHSVPAGTVASDLVSDLVRFATDDTPDDSVLADLVARLITFEVEEGGPYANAPGGTSKDTDLGMNLAAACFLARNGIRLPKLDAYIDGSLTGGMSQSQFLDANAMEELTREYRSGKVIPEENGVETLKPEEQRLMDLVRTSILERLQELPDEFTQAVVFATERTMRGNIDRQMSLMAHYVREALGEQGKRFSDKRIAELGVSNVFFWTAFIIYDDFWDEDEAAEPRLLPVANLFARHYTDLFATFVSTDPSFRAYFHTLMDQLDAANAWEMMHCRMRHEGTVVHIPDTLPAYGDFGIKFYPAAGHVLGPLALFHELGYSVDSPESTALVDYFTHYLIAMQLNDDAHDWKEDLARGHISTAVSMLLTAWKWAHPDRTTLDLYADMPELERLFWFEVLDTLCTRVLERTSASRQALESVACIKNTAPLARFIDRNERIARDALRERRMSEALLQRFA